MAAARSALLIARQREDLNVRAEIRLSMLTKTIKCGLVAGLLLASMSWHSGTNYQFLLDLAVCMSAIVMVQQAVRAREYFWATALAGIVLFLNPVVPAFTPAGNLIFFLFFLVLLPLAIGFAALVDATVTLYPNLIAEPYLQKSVSEARGWRPCEVPAA
jgi:hypothetical protein